MYSITSNAPTCDAHGHALVHLAVHSVSTGMVDISRSAKHIQSPETPIAGSAPSMLNLSEAIAWHECVTSLVGCWTSPKISPLLRVAPKTHG